MKTQGRILRIYHVSLSRNFPLTLLQGIFLGKPDSDSDSDSNTAWEFDYAEIFCAITPLSHKLLRTSLTLFNNIAATRSKKILMYTAESRKSTDCTPRKLDETQLNVICEAASIDSC